MPQTSQNHPSQRTPLLMYDGTCGLCNFCVRLLLRIDRKGKLRFAPLQGPTAQAILRERGLPTEDFDSLILVPDFPRKDGPHWVKTDGVLHLLREMGGAWRVISLLRVVPRWLRDPLYKMLARMRYRLFGEYRPRPWARSEWAARILE